MELVYLYAGHLGKGIENTGINFSKNFEVTYDLANSRISIQRRKVTEERKKLFGKNIEDISVIVGKNGAGKSTIMRLLGLPRIEYLDYFGFHDEKGIHSWFAVYHLRDNEFIIEGSYSPILAGNFDDANGDETESKHGIMPIYCISFRYDLDRKSDEPSLFTDITQMEVSGSSAYDERFKDIFLLFFGNPAGVSWFDDYTPTQRILVNNDNRLRRVVSDRSSLTSIMRYLLRTQDDENDYSKRIGNLPGVAIRLELRRHQGFRGFDWIDVSSSEEITKRTDFSKEIAQKIYLSRDIVPLWSYDGTNGNSGFSHKKHFILAYLEDLVYEYIEEYTNNTGDDDYSQAIKPFAISDELEYEKRKVFLNEHLYEVCTEGYFAEVVEKLETIPAKYFLANNILEIPLRKEKECSVPEIIGLLDENEHDRYYSYIKLRNKEFLHCIFTGMSSGEAHFIDVLSSIDGALENWKYNNRADENYGKTCVLLMDEPDTSFHPEWSRSFIKNLVDYLNSKDVPFKFQVIITTHSPLMLSDIPSDSIYCLAKNNEGKHEVKRPAFGFLSGINDLLVDGFFTESVFGQFAEDYANDLINQIEKMENAFITGKMDSASDEEEYQKILRRVYVLDEGIVRRSLVNRLERIHYWYRVRTGGSYDKG